MRFQLKYYVIFYCFFLVACTNQSGRKEKQPLIVKHVFANGLPSPYSGFRADVRHDYYYVYNYTDADYPLIEKTLDTLSVDTAYRYHTYLILAYDENLPDTSDLKSEMEGQYVPELGIDLGSAEYKKYVILGFRFIEGFLSEADQVRPEKLIPDSYRITTYEGNKPSDRYFIKDSVNGKLIEVDKSVVSIPDSGIR